jgi:hypothetical protein
MARVMGLDKMLASGVMRSRMHRIQSSELHSPRAYERNAKE